MKFWILGAALLLTSCAHKPADWSQVQKEIQKMGIVEGLSGGYGILQGPTSKDQTILVVMRPFKQDLKYFLRTPSQVVEMAAQTQNLEKEGYALDHIRVQSKEDGAHYLYVYDDGQKLKDVREFFFLDPSKSELKWVVASCMNDLYQSLQLEMWDQVASHKPDFMLFIGDNVYADFDPEGRAKITPPFLVHRYVSTRKNLRVFRWPRLIPIFSVWDDHDYGKNNGGREFFLKKDMAELFTQFFPQNSIEGFYDNGPGVASKIHFKNFDVVLFDDRSFRSTDHTPPETHFGQDQEQWFFKDLNSKKLNFLVSGDQWFGAYHQFESYEGSHPKSFQTFLAKLKKKKAPVVFVSGDRHLTEIMKIPPQSLGRSAYEVTSSGIHATMYAGSFKSSPNPRQWVGVDGEANYALFEVKQDKKISSVLVKSLGQQKKTLFEKTLSIR